MIKVKVCYENNFIKSFEVKGHADFDTYGKDIVCASVSSIVITSINLACKFDETLIKSFDKEGIIKVEIIKEDEIINKVFVNMLDMLKELEKQYKKNIKIL